MATAKTQKPKTSRKPKDPKKPLVTVEVDQECEALVQGDRTETLPAVLQGNPEFGGLTGEFDAGDIKIPELELVHGVGDLSETFDPGSIVYNGELVLAIKGDPVFMSVLSMRKFYRESLPYDPDRSEPARVFASLEEVKEAGLQSEWIDNRKPDVDKVAELWVAVECPEGLDPELFPVIINDNGNPIRMAPATFYVTRTSYAPVAKQVFSAAAMTLKGKLPAGRWRLVALREKRKGNVVTIPAFRLVGRYSDAVTSEIYAQLNWD